MAFRHNTAKSKRWKSLKQTKKLLVPVYGIAALALIFNPIMPLAKYLPVHAASADNVVINEIYTNGSNDWVEIYNNGPSTIGQGNFKDYKVTDSDGNEWGFPEQNFSSGEYLVIETSNRFNNSGDMITLFDKQDNELDSVTYGNTENAAPEADQSLSRLPNGTGDFELAFPTKNATNQPLANNVARNTDDGVDYPSLQEAIDSSDTTAGEEIVLLKDVTTTERVNVSKSIQLDGAGYEISPDFEKTSNSNNAALAIGADNVTVSNLTIDGSDGTNLHGINIYESNGINLNNLSVNNNDNAGIIVNGSTVTAANLSTTGNGWYAVNIDQGSGVTLPASFTATGTSIHEESFHVYIDDTTKDVTFNDPEDQYHLFLTLGDTDIYNLGAGSDNEDPVTASLSESKPGDDSFWNSPIEIAGTSTDNEGVDYVNIYAKPAGSDDSNYEKVKEVDNPDDDSPFEWSTTWAPDEEGAYDIKAAAVDTSGNEENSAYAHNVTYDTAAPDAPTITSPGARTWHKTTPITNSWTAVTDDSGIDHYRVAYLYDDGHTFGGSTCPGLVIDGQSVSGCRDETATSRNHTPTPGEQGGVTVWVRAVDNAGNMSPWSDSVHYYYDSTDPVTDIVVGGFENSADRLTDHEFTVNGTATDNLSLNRVYVQLVNRQDNQRYGGTTIHLIGEGTNANWSRTYNANTLNLPDGDYAAHVAVVDRAGNKSTAGWTDDFKVDTTTPQQATDSQFYFGHTKTGTALACSVSDGPIYTNTDDVLIDWEHANPSDVEYYWFGINNANNYNETHKNSQDNPGEFIDGGTAYKVDITSANNNPHRYLVTAVDAAGNKSTILETCPVILDQEDPVAEVVAPADGDLLTGTVNLEGQVTDDNPMNSFFRITGPGDYEETSFFSDGRTLHEFSWDTTSVADGTYTIFFATRDKADNKDGDKNTPGVSVDSITVTVDNTAPTTEITGPNDGDTVNGTLDVLGNVLDNINLRHYNLSLYPSSTDLSDGLTHSSDRLNGIIGWGSGTVNVSGTNANVNRQLDTTLLVDGEYQLRLAARDASGNRDTSSIDGAPSSVHVIAFSVDNTIADVESDNDDTEGQVEGVQTTNQQNQNNQQQSNTFQQQTTNTDNNNESETDETEENNNETTSSNTNENGQNNGEVAGTATSEASGGGLGMWWLIIAPVLLGILFFALRRRTSDEES